MNALVKLLTSKQVVFLVRDLGLTIASAVLTELGPLALTPGLAKVTNGQWQGVLDHTAATVIIAISALVGTPLTRKYGVGAVPLEVPADPSPQG